MIWHDLVLWCISRDFGGLENLSLIPGTVGAAPIQNIGAYGVEFDSVFEGLEAVDMKTGAVYHFSKADCQFGYRDSIFKRSLKGRFAITAVYVRLTQSDHQINTNYSAIRTYLDQHKIKDPTIGQVSEAIIAIRRSKLPDPKHLGNGGSFFKNPILDQDKYVSLQQMYPDIPGYQQSEHKVKVPAAWLIERCGWKGYRSGDAGIYDKHALVLVNFGHASGMALYQLALAVQESVQAVFAVTLEPEVNILGA